MKYSNPQAIVTSLLTRFVKSHLGGPSRNVTAEVIANSLVGAKIANHYRPDFSDQERKVVSIVYLRGALTDRAV